MSYLNHYISSPPPSQTSRRSSPANEDPHEPFIESDELEGDNAPLGDACSDHEEADAQHGSETNIDPSLSRSSSVSNPYELSQWKPTARKHALSEDTVAYAKHEARHILLNSRHQEALVEYAKMDLAQQNVCLYGISLKIHEDIQWLTLVGTWSIPSSLMSKSKIIKYGFIVLMNPAISSYTDKNVGVKIVLDLLQKYPGWGLVPQIAKDMDKMKIIKEKIQWRLTDVRSTLKHIISEHTQADAAKDIHVLCRAVVDAYAKIAPKLQVSLKMLVRFAFLRHIFVAEKAIKGQDHNYWLKVDSAIKTFQEEKKNDMQKISEIFQRIFDGDRRDYGEISLHGLPKDTFVSINYHVEAHEITAGQS